MAKFTISYKPLREATQENRLSMIEAFNKAGLNVLSPLESKNPRMVGSIEVEGEAEQVVAVCDQHNLSWFKQQPKAFK